MDAVVWSDYLCPWCYVARDRSARLEALGVTLTSLPYELHPEIPPEGRPVRAGGRLGAVFDRIAAECADAGLPFRRPTRTPNTRRALETAEVVRAGWPEAFRALDAAFFRAHFVEGTPLDDRDALDDLVAGAGAPAGDVRDTVDAGGGRGALQRSMDSAREAGVAATPAWLVDGRFMIPGVQPRETMERWVVRLLSRAGAP